jgi:transcriptional regulator with XRE-family HTH domain
MKTFIISPTLVRAARALLGWQQVDLAKAAGLSLTAVNNFERKIGLTRDNTILAIRNALEEGGVEFLSGGGLRHIEDVAAVGRFTGSDFIDRWTEDIMAAVRNSGDEIWTASTDEALWFQPSVTTINDVYLEWAERLQLKLKTLVPVGEKILHRTRITYRTIPSEMIGRITYCVYSNRLAFVLWKKKQVIVLRNNAVTETFRNQFNYFWRIGKPV